MKFTENVFHFLDGYDDPSTLEEPALLHFRHHSILDVHARREECWAKLIGDRVLLPADTIKLYDPDGKLTAILIYKDKAITFQLCDPHSQRKLVRMETHPFSCKKRALPMNPARLTLHSPSVDPAIHSLPEAIQTITLVYDNCSACMNNSVHIQTCTSINSFS